MEKIVLGLMLPLGCLAAPFATFPDGCVTPDGMTIDAQDRLVIAAANFADTKKPGALFRIDNPGEQPYKWLDLPVNPATGRCSPMGIAYGDDGSLYVVDNQPWTGESRTKNQGRLLRLEIKDDRLAAWHVIAEGMEHPNGVKFHKGKLYLTQSSLSPIKDASGLLVSGVYRFDPSDRNVKVANTKADRNLVFTVTTKNKFCQYGLDGLAFDAEGRLYVGNFGDGEVSRIVFDAAGNVASLSTFAKSPFDIARDPAKPDFLKYATSCPMRTTDGMCFGPDGWLYVADFSNNAIAKVSPDGKRVEFVRRDEDGKWLEGKMNQPGEPIFWRGRLIASNFDAVAGTPDKTNAKTELPATLSEILPAPLTSWTNPLVQPTGVWKAWCDKGPWPYAWVSEKAGDAVEVEFEGTSFTVCHRKGACRWIWGMTFRDQTSPLGFFEAFVDGKSVGTFDSSLREETCVAKGLTDGRHVARIVNLGRSSRKGGPGRIALRGFRTDRPPRLPTPDLCCELPGRARAPCLRMHCPELAAEVKTLSPILFFTGSPLRSGAIPNYVWQTNPQGPWGCSIRLFDPATDKTRVLFEEKDSIILDMSLSPDASTILFTMRRHGAKTWQIYALRTDGSGFRQLTDTPQAHNASPAFLPGGRIAFLSTRTPFTHNVCQPGPSTHVYVMDADGGNARDLSSNTLSDLYLSVLSDGRLFYTRWEYVDWNLTYRQSLWTQYPDGRQMSLWFGNLTEDPASIIQAREIPGEYGSAVCTFAPHHGSPYGAIGIVSNREGPEGDNAPSMRWITPEIPSVFDRRYDWGWCWPAPVKPGRFLASCGDEKAKRFRLMLLADDGCRAVVYEDPVTSVFGAVPFVARPAPKEIAPLDVPSPATVTLEAAPPGQSARETVPMGQLFVSDVYKGFAEGLPRGEVKAVRVMEQIPKTVNRTWNGILDQGPLVGSSSYYPKRVWGYAPVAADGSVFFQAPARKEIYLQLVDGAGRELVRMTSAINLMPGETQSCTGCHENRRAAAVPMSAIAARGGPVALDPPPWGNARVLDYNKVVQPVWDRHCVRCHSGANPPKGMNLTGHYTRFFSMSYDSLVNRSKSDRVFRAWFTGDSAEKPLVQSFHLLTGLTETFRAKESGSFGSRLPEYLEKSHHGVDMPAADKRIVYEWLDAMIPYYPTFDYAHIGAKGDRDKWGEPDGPALKPWFQKRFLPLYKKNCASCHGKMDMRVKNTNFVEPYWWWFDLTEPTVGPALMAHLPKKDGGRGCTANGKFSFASRQDPIWKELLDIAHEAAREAWRTPEADMPGFVPRSRGRCEYRP